MRVVSTTSASTILKSCKTSSCPASVKRRNWRGRFKSWSIGAASFRYSVTPGQIGRATANEAQHSCAGTPHRFVWRFHAMSALPHKADIDCRDCDVRFVPISDIEDANHTDEA